ncbi:MAG: nuclear transport factor 2 family protein, partial [Glaciimonas sp.]|nr:nuclear transport factor 2 family protein [Glaciimonas sp.]
AHISYAANSDEVAVSATLDQLHQAASEADGAKYLSLFTDNAVYFGLSALQRWPIEQFRSYAQERFGSGTGWTYTKLSRNVTLSPDGNTAWFDERLNNANYGIALGTGAMVKQNGQWKIAQYNLTLQIPVDMLPKIAKDIMARDAKTHEELPIKNNPSPQKETK